MPPVGAVIEQDGPLIRTHYSTHGTVDHGHLPTTDLGTPLRRGGHSNTGNAVTA
jgi:hypothetical protein